MNKNLSFIRDKHIGKFTQIANSALQDKNISLKARGLLSFLLTLNEKWDCTDEGLAIATGEGITSLRSAIKELEASGYLVKTKTRGEKNQYSKTQWRVYENPANGKSSDANPPTGNLSTEKRRQYNNKSNKIEKSNIVNNIQSIGQIRERLEYDILVEKFPRRTNEIDGLIDIITDILNSNKPEIYVGELKPTAVVQSRFMKLNHEHICEVLEKFLEIKVPITNPLNYLTKMLYMQPTMSDLEMDNRVNSDMTKYAYG